MPSLVNDNDLFSRSCLPDLALAWYSQLIFTNIFTKLSTVTRGQSGKKCEYYSIIKFGIARVCASKTDFTYAVLGALSTLACAYYALL